MSIVDKMKKKADEIAKDRNTQVGIDRYGRPYNRLGENIVKYPYKDRYGRIVHKNKETRIKITLSNISYAIRSRKKHNDKER